MKICHTVPSLEERHGGPSKSVRALCAALAREGNEVSLLVTEPDEPQPRTVIEEGVRLATFHRDWPERICRSSGLRRALFASDAAVIHHHSIWLRTLHYARRGAARTGVPLVVSPRGMMSDWAWNHRPWRKRFSRWAIHPGALEAVAGWHATSAEEEQEIRARGFHQPICVAPNGVDAPEEVATAAAAQHWQEACPELKTRRVALFYSRFHPKKRVIELIDAWLACAPADWLLLLVGIPQDYTPEMLNAYARQNSAGDRVRAFSGVGQPAPFAAASLFLLPSHNENFGLVVAEAMAHGVPVVVTDTTPWSEITRKNLGWCVAWPHFTDAIRTATSESAARLQERGRAAREWVLREFSWAHSARQLAAFYETLRATVP